MSKYIVKDKYIRNNFKYYEKYFLILKYIINNEVINKKIRISAFKKLEILQKKVKRTKITNRCIMTGRGRSVLSMYKLSRIMFRKLASNGVLYGVKKISW